ncbi:MAG: hypothetical protein M3N14_01620 [Bacteroidota bacterium]|nr:hypothetical protein [Bacteroidota bacterium]
MYRLKSAKFYFFLAVLLFVAKPFLGFSMVTRINPPAADNILIKSFTKRKLEYIAGGNFDINLAQKKLSEPVQHLIVPFVFLLSILFPFVFESGINITGGVLSRMRLRLRPIEHISLLNGKLII